MEPAAVPQWAELIQASAPAVTLRASLFLYPLANTLHVLGLALLVGAIVALDLRLLGLARDLPAKAASRLLTAVALVGLAVAIPTGIALFIADAAGLVLNRVLWLKLGLVALGLVNAIVFRALWSRRLDDWDWAAPPAARLQSASSIVLWLGAASAGRLIAYF